MNIAFFKPKLSLNKTYHTHIFTTVTRASQARDTTSDLIGWRCLSRWRWFVNLLSVLYRYISPFFSVVQHTVLQQQRWQEQSRPLVNPPVERLHANSWLPRPLARAHQQPAVSRSLTDTGPEPSPFVKSEGTRRAPSSSSGNCHSSAWFVKSLRTSRLTSDSRAPQSWLSKRPARLTWSAFSRTPTCAQSTPSVSPSCQRTSSSHAVFAVNVPKRLYFWYLHTTTALFRAT